MNPVRPPFSKLGSVVVVAVMLCPFGISAGEAITPVISNAARPLPLTAVRLTGGPLKKSQDLDAQYLLDLEPDRMLAGYRIRAGLEPKAKGYGGWDSVEGKQLTGHIGGHYLSAVSLMFAATGDRRFKERADYIVAELKEVQDKHGDGYLGALANGKERFAEVAQGNIRSGGFDLNGLWSPWYVLHKTYAGLRDAYRHTGNRTALELEIKFAAWAERILSDLNDSQIQRMLNTEFGGMNEIFADLYADTGDTRWLELSYIFEHRAFTDPLKRHQDNLAGKHGNTQVPKMIGSLARFGYVGDPGDGFAASFFWDRVVQHHSYATGGHGKDEYFGEPDKLNDRVDGRTAETCNVYNMLKMTRALFALRPDAHYADFHERALFNHILASQDPEDGWACYMVPVGRGVQHEYERNMRDGGFTCCVGSSMESHALHSDGLYYEAGDKLWVNVYAPSTADWQAGGVQLTTETYFPEGESVTITLTMAGPKEFTLLLRRPFWTGTNFAVSINGKPIAQELLALPGSEPSNRRSPAAQPNTSWFVESKRNWQSGDQITVSLPKSLRLEPLPDNPRRVAILWGPLVLAGDLGPEQRRRGSWAEAVPVFVAAERPVQDWLKPVPGRPGSFRTEGVGKDRDVDFVPFYRLHRRTYAVYWDLFTPPEWEKHSAELAAERERQRQLEAATVGFVQPGEMQAERDANMQGEDTQPVRLQGLPGRRSSKWFSFDLPVDPARPMALVVTYNHDEWQERTFEILVDGVRIGEQAIERRGPMRFFDVQYPVPPGAVKGKEKVTVRFQATQGNETGAVFGIRMIRAGAASATPAGASDSVQPVPSELRERLGLAPFYQKHLDVSGFPIVGSSNVSDFALLEAGWIIRQMLPGREDILRAMATNRVRLAVMAWNEYTTDVPEHSDLTSKVFWDRRARGLGATRARPAVSCAEENLLCYPGDPYLTENILIHEFAHTIHQIGLRRLDPTFDARLKAAFEKATEKGLWQGTYAGSNRAEYWAEGVQDWFDNNRENDSLHNRVNTRAELKAYDPGLAALCAEIFGDGPWRYRKPAEREVADRAHLAGFDPAKAPRFVWREEPLTARPKVSIQTTIGNIEVELDAEHAPVTTKNFLRYAQAGLYSNGRFHRTVRLDNQPTDTVRIEVIQASADPAKTNEFFAPISLERTGETGLKHLDGTISMARSGPDSAQDHFFICIGDQPELDFGGARNPDGQGFAAFGRVVDGQEVVRKIHGAPAERQSLNPPVLIQRVIRTE
ncbi:MAG: beta-L-arabinofuranosidase domain-containing protein [Verrucomicrobiia bacterium]